MNIFHFYPFSFSPSICIILVLLIDQAPYCHIVIEPYPYHDASCFRLLFCYRVQICQLDDFVSALVGKHFFILGYLVIREPQKILGFNLYLSWTHKFSIFIKVRIIYYIYFQSMTNTVKLKLKQVFLHYFELLVGVTFILDSSGQCILVPFRMNSTFLIYYWFKSLVVEGKSASKPRLP